ncbi:MAG: hypothetical protein Q7K29_08680 [Thermoleophilia bacterium]|nr:hypothetical protein [Thermoleophilia bacterium]
MAAEGDHHLIVLIAVATALGRLRKDDYQQHYGAYEQNKEIDMAIQPSG